MRIFWRRCGETRKGFGSRISAKFVIISLVSPENPVPATGYISRLGRGTLESIFRTPAEKRKPIKCVRFFWPFKKLRLAMSKKVDRYTYRVTWSEEDQEYVGLCAEFRSLSWLEKTQEKALQGIRKAVAETVADLIRAKEPVPEPLSAKPYSGKFMVRVPPEIHRSLAIRAAESGVSLNRLISSKLS